MLLKKIIVCLFVSLISYCKIYSQTHEVSFSEDYLTATDSLNKWIHSNDTKYRIYAYNILFVSESYDKQYYDLLLADPLKIEEDSMEYSVAEYYFYKLMTTKKRYLKCSHPFFKIALREFKNSQNRYIRMLVNNLSTDDYLVSLSGNNAIQEVIDKKTTADLNHELNLLFESDFINDKRLLINYFEIIDNYREEFQNIFIQDSITFNQLLKNNSFELLTKYYLYQEVKLPNTFCFKETCIALNKIENRKFKNEILRFYYQLIEYYYPQYIEDFALLFSLNLTKEYLYSVSSNRYCYPFENLIYEIEVGVRLNSSSEYKYDSELDDINKIYNIKFPFVQSNYFDCFK